MHVHLRLLAAERARARTHTQTHMIELIATPQGSTGIIANVLIHMHLKRMHS